MKLTPEMEKQKVRVTVYEARGIKAADIGGTSDPYVEVRIKNQGLSGKTKTIKKTLNPFWNEEFDVYYNSIEYDVLSVKLYDHDAFGSNDLLGELELPIASAISKMNKKDEWFQLQERKGTSFVPAKGEIRLGFKGDVPNAPPPYNPSFTSQQFPANYPPSYPPPQNAPPPLYPQYTPTPQNYPPPQYPPVQQQYPPTYPPQNYPPPSYPNYPPPIQTYTPPPQQYPPPQYPPAPIDVPIVTTVVTPQTPLYPTVVQEDWTVIESLHNGKVLDIKGGSSTPGAEVIVYNHHGNNNQLWRLTSDGHIISKLGLALTYKVREDNTILIVDVVKDEDIQKWTLDGEKIINKYSQEALQIRETDNQVILWYPSPQSIQRWKFNVRQSPKEASSHSNKEYKNEISEDWITIESRHSGYLLDIEGANGKPGSKVIVWPHNNGENQKWKYKKGFLKSKLNKKLVLSFNSDGTLIVEKKDKHDDRQRWEIRDGLIVNVSNGKAIDISGASRSQGAKVIVWERHGNSNQLWNLKKA